MKNIFSLLIVCSVFLAGSSCKCNVCQTTSRWYDVTTYDPAFFGKSSDGAIVYSREFKNALDFIASKKGEQQYIAVYSHAGILVEAKDCQLRKLDKFMSKIPQKPGSGCHGGNGAGK